MHRHPYSLRINQPTVLRAQFHGDYCVAVALCGDESILIDRNDVIGIGAPAKRAETAVVVGGDTCVRLVSEVDPVERNVKRLLISWSCF